MSENNNDRYIPKTTAWKTYDVSRALLNLAIKRGEVAIRRTGINRIKVRESDVLRLINGTPSPAPATTDAPTA